LEKYKKIKRNPKRNNFQSICLKYVTRLSMVKTRDLKYYFLLYQFLYKLLQLILRFWGLRDSKDTFRRVSVIHNNDAIHCHVWFCE
jgi:hypothetical protein